MPPRWRCRATIRPCRVACCSRWRWRACSPQRPASSPCRSPTSRPATSTKCCATSSSPGRAAPFTCTTSTPPARTTSWPACCRCPSRWRRVRRRCGGEPGTLALVAALWMSGSRAARVAGALAAASWLAVRWRVGRGRRASRGVHTSAGGCGRGGAGGADAPARDWAAPSGIERQRQPIARPFARSSSRPACACGRPARCWASASAPTTSGPTSSCRQASARSTAARTRTTTSCRSRPSWASSGSSLFLWWLGAALAERVARRTTARERGRAAGRRLRLRGVPPDLRDRPSVPRRRSRHPVLGQPCGGVALARLARASLRPLSACILPGWPAASSRDSPASPLLWALVASSGLCAGPGPSPPIR